MQWYLDVLTNFPTPLSYMRVESSFSFIILRYFLFETIIRVRGWKFTCKDRGEGGGKQSYLYIVKIEIFHPILTPSLSK